MSFKPFELNDNGSSSETTKFLCLDLTSIHSRGVWFNHNPLQYSVPLFLLQLTIISLSSTLISLCLHPLKQPSIVSQILGGIILGPSMLGHIKAFTAEMFPLRGAMVIETFAAFGLMFFFFVMGVKMDPKMMLKPGRISLIIGLSAVVSTFVFTTSLALILKRYVSMNENLAISLPYIAASQTLTAFPNIACLLTELKLLNSELGRLAVNTSMFCDMIGLCLTAICFSVLGNTQVLKVLYAFLSIIAFAMVIFYVFRPTILWIQRNITEETLTNELSISILFTIALIAGLGTDIIGQHYAIGSLMIGMAVPDGPPLGAALVAKLDCIVSKVLYPTFLAVSGLQINIFAIHVKSWVIVLSVVLFGTLVKFGAVLLAGYCTNVPLRDGVVLGLLLNTRGVCELVLFKFLHESEILNIEDFTLTVVYVLTVTVTITPLIRILYDHPTHQTPVKRTIQQSKKGRELRILLCIHNQENAPVMMDLLEASNATEEGPISVTALILTELVGRTTPMLIAHNPQPALITHSGDISRCHIINALHKYGNENEAYASVQSFSAISHFDMMHEDICRMALDQNTTIIILPFHKIWAIDGSIGSVHRATQNTNIKVLEEAPCSVGILIDRSLLRGKLSTFNSHSTFRVLILYIGGCDDIESLSYGARMASHKNVTVTLLRFLLLGYETSQQHKYKNNLVNAIRDANEENEAFFYREQVVRDGVGLSACITALEDCYELIIAGRHHQQSSLLKGLEAWSECPELGPVGDMLASPHFGKRASILVVQQQKIGGKLISRGSKPVVVDDRDINRPSNGTEWSGSKEGSQRS